MHLESLECTYEARVTLSAYASLRTSRVHPQLDKRTLSMNQFLSEDTDLCLEIHWNVTKFDLCVIRWTS